MRIQPFVVAIGCVSLLAVPSAVAQARCASFSNSHTDPNGARIEVPYAPQLVPQSGITVEAWITYDDTSLGNSTPYRWPTIVRTGINGAQNAFNFRIDASNNNTTELKFTVNANSRAHVRWPFASGRLLQWTHVAGTYDGTTLRLIVDGVEVASTPLSGDIRDVGQTIRIGQGADNSSSNNECWNGEIDELRIWPFARTAGEIAATKDMELTSVPGLVSTWNLDGNGNDSSSGQNGTPVGAASWSPNASATLATAPFPGLAVGMSTTGCLGAMHATVSSLPNQGNADFAFVGHRGPANAQAVALLSTSPAAAPIPLAGIDLWVDASGLIGGFAVGTDGRGVARLPLPIPSTAPAGFTLAVQFGVLDPCGPMGLTATDAVGVATVP